MLLSDNYKKIILSLLTGNIKNNIKVLVYGSRINGRAHSGSDLDLVIRSEDNKPLDIKELVNLKENLTESNIPFLVDVLDWNRIPDYFKENILQNYEVLK
jgi:predicted nucleotidyltransferase